MVFKNKNLLKLLVLAALFTWPTHCLIGQPMVFMTKSGHAEFTSDVPSHSFTGESDYLVGKVNLADSTVDFYLDLSTLKTGIGMRDQDMYETLEVDEYPFAEFFGKLTSEYDPRSTKPQEVTVSGEFTLHGVTKDFQATGEIQRTEEGLKVDARWELDMTEYGVEPPGILFYKVSDVMGIQISALLDPVEE